MFDTAAEKARFYASKKVATKWLKVLIYIINK